MKNAWTAPWEVLSKEFKGLRAGRAATSLIAPLDVRAYGDAMQPLEQLASLTVVDARTLSIQVWDSSVVSAVEKAINESDLGLTPQTEGAVIRLHLPSPSAERRKELAKLAARYAEEAAYCGAQCAARCDRFGAQAGKGQRYFRRTRSNATATWCRR